MHANMCTKLHHDSWTSLPPATRRRLGWVRGWHVWRYLGDDGVASPTVGHTRDVPCAAFLSSLLVPSAGVLRFPLFGLFLEPPLQYPCLLSPSLAVARVLPLLRAGLTLLIEGFPVLLLCPRRVDSFLHARHDILLRSRPQGLREVACHVTCWPWNMPRNPIHLHRGARWARECHTRRRRAPLPAPLPLALSQVLPAIPLASSRPVGCRFVG